MWLQCCCYRSMDIRCIEFPLKKRENPVRCYETADSLNGIECRCEFKQFPRRASFRRSELVHDLTSQLREVRESCPSLRDAGATEKHHVALVAGKQQIIRNRGAMRNKSHKSDRARLPPVVEINSFDMLPGRLPVGSLLAATMRLTAAHPLGAFMTAIEISLPLARKRIFGRGLRYRNHLAAKSFAGMTANRRAGKGLLMQKIDGAVGFASAIRHKVRSKASKIRMPHS